MMAPKDTVAVALATSDGTIVEKREVPKSKPMVAKYRAK